MQEQGFTKEGAKPGKDGKPESINVAQGHFSYTSPEGVPISVSYIADENGFQTFENEMPDSAGQGGNGNGPKKMPPTPQTKMQPSATTRMPNSAGGHGMKASAAQILPPYYAFSYPAKSNTVDVDEDEEEESEEEEQEHVYPTPMLYRY